MFVDTLDEKSLVLGLLVLKYTLVKIAGKRTAKAGDRETTVKRNGRTAECPKDSQGVSEPRESAVAITATRT